MKLSPKMAKSLLLITALGLGARSAWADTTSTEENAPYITTDQPPYPGSVYPATPYLESSHPPSGPASPDYTPPYYPGPFQYCSRPSNAGVQVTFTNYCPASVMLYWVDFQCNEIPYAAIPPGGQIFAYSYLGHSWRLRWSSAGALFGNDLPINSPTFFALCGAG